MIEYKKFINEFLKHNYQFAFFDNFEKEGNIVLRHDIDFDCEMAYKMSCTEKDMGIFSTYFFLLRTDFYNIFSIKNTRYINKIINNGHKVSLHFDPSCYSGDSILHELRNEIDIFSNWFSIEINIVSIHRPSRLFVEGIDVGIKHTYEDKYSKDIKYMSDSGGMWKHGNPLYTKEFLDKKTFQILIHPIWWYFDSFGSNLNKLNNFLNIRFSDIKNDVGNNCLPFKNKSEGYL